MVLSQEEVRAVLTRLDSSEALVAGLLTGRQGRQRQEDLVDVCGRVELPNALVGKFRTVALA